MTGLDLDAPQLGEHVWHAFTADPAIGATSREHRARIEAVVGKHLRGFDWRRGRLLEVGAYRHTTGHLLAAERGCEFVLTDIAAPSLRDGRAQALRDGGAANARLVVADFHDLPFSDGYFDAVFVASSVHHTRRPERVLHEMLRVLGPGGVLMLENEPCARECCFHAFVTNREESFTPCEAELHRAGLLPTLSSPFWGARAEALFGMVENDRIPLALFEEAFAAHGEALERTLSLHGLVGPFERDLLRLRGQGEALRAQVLSHLRAAVERARSCCGARERLLGWELPGECEIHALATRVAALLERRPHDDDERWQAELFGAALRAVVRKRGAPGARAAELFRRPMAVEADGLVRERIEAGSVAAGLGAPLLPDLYAALDRAVLDPWFPAADWHHVVEQHGAVSLANLGARGRVTLPEAGVERILVVRYFAVVENETPYRLRIWGAGRLLDEQTVVLQESRLARARVPPGCAGIEFEIAGLDGAPVAAGWQLRLGVVQLFALRTG